MTSLPTKQQYLDALRSVTDPRDQPHCSICWGDWDNPATEIVEASTHCSLHPLHKACLISTFTTRDGKEGTNRCPICRRELFETITTTTHYDNDSTGSDVVLAYAWDNDPDVRLAMADEFWVSQTIPLLDGWLEHDIVFESLDDLLSRPADQRLSAEGWSCIDEMIHYRLPQRLELTEKIAVLLNHLFGDTLLRYIRAGNRYFAMSELSTSSWMWVQPSMLKVAFYIVTTFLLDYGVGQNLFGKQMDIHEWLSIVRFRQLLWEELWAEDRKMDIELGVSFTTSIASLLGLPDFEPMRIAIESVLVHHDGEEQILEQAIIKLPPGPHDKGFSVAFDEEATIFQIGPFGNLKIVEARPGSFRECKIDYEEGCIEFIRDHDCVLRLQRIMV